MHVEREFKSQLVQIKIEAPLLVTDKDCDRAEANVKILAVGTKAAPVRLVPVPRSMAMISRRRTHGRHYSAAEGDRHSYAGLDLGGPIGISREPKKRLREADLLIVIALLVFALAAGGGLYRLKRLLRGAHKYDTQPPILPAALKDAAILVFSKTNGYRHKEAIPAANAAILSIANRNGWSVCFTENGAVFNQENLSRFKATVWNNTSGDVLNDEQKAAFRSYIESGGGFVGLHGAGGDFRYTWRWYVESLIGAQFIGHTMFPQFPMATIRVERRDDTATRELPEVWSRLEEWYSFEKSPRANGTAVLATLDETTYRARMAWKDIRMGTDHPIIWRHRVGNGRAFYSAIGHHASAYEEQIYLSILRGAIAWAAGIDGGTPVT